MNKAGVEKARIRLADANVAFDEVQAARDFASFRAAWSRFLIACNGIAAILESSARKDPRSRQWFGGKMKARPKDELLSYMHQARNVEEHGIEPVAEQDPGSLTIGGASGGGIIRKIGFGPGKLVLELDRWHGDLPQVTYVPPHVRLIPVVDDRYGTTFKVPEFHLGQRIGDSSPRTMGALWLSYSAALIDEAKTYIR